MYTDLKRRESLVLADLAMYSKIFGFSDAFEERDEKKELQPGDMSFEDIENASPILFAF